MTDEIDDPDNPAWTANDFARARPANEVHPPEIVALLCRKRAVTLQAAFLAQGRLASDLSLAA